MLWRLEYSREAASYALDSHPYNEAVLSAIQSLSLMPNPFPVGIAEILPGVFSWEIANHVVYYQLLEEILTVKIIAIKPLT